MDKTNIPQFNGAAYSTWALKIQFGLVEKRLITVVCDFKGRARVICPARIMPLAQGALLLLPLADRAVARDENGLDISAREAEIEKWLDMDLDAQAFIVKYIGASEQTHIRNCDTAHEMWTALETFYQLQGDIEVANAQAQLSAIVMGETEDIAVYVRRLQEIHSLLDRLHEPVSPAKQATNLLNSLNTRYFGMIDIIQTWSLTAPHLYTVPSILSTLQQKEVRTQINARKRGETSNESTESRHVNYSGPPAGRYNGTGSSGGGMGPQCHACQKYGHVVRDCPTAARCSHCGKTGHTVKDCFQLVGYPNNMRGGARNASNAREFIKCDHCGRSGHKEDACRTKMREQQKGAANRAATNATDDQSTAFDASQSLSYTASRQCLTANANAKVPLILDSGATDHIFPSIEHFSDYRTDSIPLGSRFILTADDKPHEVKGSGIVTLSLHEGMETVTVRLHALHVPSLGQTLVSLSCLNRKGQIEFHLSKHGSATLIKNDKP